MTSATGYILPPSVHGGLSVHKEYSTTARFPARGRGLREMRHLQSRSIAERHRASAAGGCGPRVWSQADIGISTFVGSIYCLSPTGSFHLSLPARAAGHLFFAYGFLLAPRPFPDGSRLLRRLGGQESKHSTFGSATSTR